MSQGQPSTASAGSGDPSVSIRASPKFDIFPKLAAFLDPHLVVPVLGSFYKELGIYEEKAVLQATLDVVRRRVWLLPCALRPAAPTSAPAPA